MPGPRFHVVNRGQYHRTPGHFVLRTSDWNDYGYYTLFELSYNDEAGELEIGQVKIATAGMSAQFGTPGANSSRTVLSEPFDDLGPTYLSLGQDREYYENLRKLPSGLDIAALQSLNDVAANEALFRRFADEDVLQTSLMRDLTRLTIETQFRRIIDGHEALTPYRFSFSKTSPSDHIPPFRVEFGVHPGYFPPTNMHVVIGANGVGKSKLLRDLVGAATVPNGSGFGDLRDEIANTGNFPFAGILHIAFSAFDSDSPADTGGDSETKVQLVGLASTSGQSLEAQYVESLRRCRSGPRRARWLSAMEVLCAADPLLADHDFAALLDTTDADGSREFASMSSGHKIVVLTMSRLVELVEERTLVLIDEPETHLHPPLLSALIRAVSDLIVGRNGVAIVATHSPVVLQEVPRSCVSVLRRVGDDLRAWNLNTESFGESVSRLTAEVFHLEVSQTGYRQTLSQLLASHDWNAERVLEAVDGQLGSEGRFVLSALAEQGNSNA